MFIGEFDTQADILMTQMHVWDIFFENWWHWGYLNLCTPLLQPKLYADCYHVDISGNHAGSQSSRLVPISVGTFKPISTLFMALPFSFFAPLTNAFVVFPSACCPWRWKMEAENSQMDSNLICRKIYIVKPAVTRDNWYKLFSLNKYDHLTQIIYNLNTFEGNR